MSSSGAPEPRARVVYVCPEAPYPPESGGRHRVNVLMRALAACAEVRLVVVGERPALAIRQRLRAEGGRVFPPKRETRAAWVLRCVRAALRGEAIPAARYLSRRRVEKLVAHVRGLRPDLVVLGDAYLTAFVPALRDLRVPLVVDTHDAASLVHARIAAASRSRFERIAYRILAANTARVERTLFPLADEVWTLSADDARFYRDVVGLSNVVETPHVVDVGPMPDATAPGEPRSAVFVGSYSYWPNEEAALRLIEVSKGLRAAGALTTLYLVGTSPTARMRAAAAGLDHVVVTGRVPDVAPYLARASVVAAPLAAGSGVKVKIMDAMAAARPIVTTPIGAEGLALTPGVHAEVATLERFAGVLADVLGDPARQARLAAAARSWAEARCSLSVLEAAVRARVDALLARSRS